MRNVGFLPVNRDCSPTDKNARVFKDFVEIFNAPRRAIRIILLRHFQDRFRNQIEALSVVPADEYGAAFDFARHTSSPR